MVALIVLLTIAVFIVVDAVLRFVMRRMQEAKVRKQRAEALDIGLRLEFKEEAPSLKRVRVEHPKASILAVDDEEVVLDSFRKILVLAGYSVDTVETGPEALGLIRKNDYDFVFTDLKMPEMDGIEVTKAVKHLRPDIDVIMITGYATIESAVETMKYGAMDYVQKPFTEDELVTFVDKSLIRRQDRIEREMKPTVHLVTPSEAESRSTHEFNVPAGVFVSPTHTWANIELNGMIRVGLDDFAQKIIGEIDEVELPRKGQKIQKGDALFSIKQDSRSVTFISPVSGEVKLVNAELFDRVELIKIKPYELGWICCIEPSSLSSDLQALKIGAEAVTWYRQEIDRFYELMKKVGAEKDVAQTHGEGNGKIKKHKLDEAAWDAFSKSFLHV